ncbi:hypothetical protein E4U59_007930 [Claviceps monticola]|nr:hypothetical protein E4U59_007930 [Claviceps monticola]
MDVTGYSPSTTGIKVDLQRAARTAMHIRKVVHTVSLPTVTFIRRRERIMHSSKRPPTHNHSTSALPPRKKRHHARLLSALRGLKRVPTNMAGVSDHWTGATRTGANSHVALGKLRPSSSGWPSSSRMKLRNVDLGMSNRRDWTNAVCSRRQQETAGDSRRQQETAGDKQEAAGRRRLARRCML